MNNVAILFWTREFIIFFLRQVVCINICSFLFIWLFFERLTSFYLFVFKCLTSFYFVFELYFSSLIRRNLQVIIKHKKKKRTWSILKLILGKKLLNVQDLLKTCCILISTDIKTMLI